MTEEDIIIEEETIQPDILVDLQDTFNEDTIEELIEDGEIENAN